MVSQFSTFRQLGFGRHTRAAHSPQVPQQHWDFQSLKGLFFWGGGWYAQASDRYARIAIRRTTNMQRSVITAWQSQSDDPLAEEESTEILTLSWKLKVWMQPKELSVSSL